MSNKIVVRKTFLNSAKRLAKKYRSFQEDLANLFAELRSNAEIGTALGDDIYKIRLAIKSKGRGKSGGARVITYFYRVGNVVYLVKVYDKADMEDMSETDLKRMIAELKSDIRVKKI